MNFLDYYFKVIIDENVNYILYFTFYLFLSIYLSLLCRKGRDVVECVKIRGSNYLSIKNTIPINTNIPTIGNKTNNHDTDVNPFLHNKLSNQVHNIIYKILTAKNAKL